MLGKPRYQLLYWPGILIGDGEAVGTTAINIGTSKVGLDPVKAFIRGVLCNALVCLAAWLCLVAHGVCSKILAIIFPISAFVALGFEHCIANMYFIALGILLSDGAIGVGDLAHNLVPVTLGNIVGGGVFVALVYWLVYLRDYD